MTLQHLREEMDAINGQLVELIGKRTEVARAIARIKKRENLPILDPVRERAIQEEVRRLARANRVSVSVVEEIFRLLLDYTRLEMEMEGI